MNESKLGSLSVVKISIERSDIEAGTPHVGTECPVMIAIRRTLGEDVVDRITRKYIKFNDGTRRRSPIMVQQFCSRYDAGSRVEPFTFELRLRVA